MVCFMASRRQLFSDPSDLHCMSEKLESIPIGETEAYHMNIDSNGISMEFWNLKK